MFLGLDLGTTSVKAVLVRSDGGIVARGSAPVRLFHVAGGGVEQEIEEIWSGTLATIGQIVAQADVSSVKAIGVSAQGGAMQIVNGAGRPVGRLISWLDGRGRKYDEEATRELGRRWFVHHTGHGQSNVAVGQLLRLRQESPDLLSPPNRIGFAGDLVVSRLCGRAAHDATSLSIAWLYNPSLRSADPELMRWLHIELGQLPALVSVQTPAGGLLEEVAGLTSLPAGIPVSPAVHDQYAAALGAGVIHAGDVMLGAGTAWVLLAVSMQLAKPVIDAALVCTHIVDGRYGQMLSMVNGGSALAWAGDLLGLAGKSCEEIDAMMEKAPPGSDGLMFWPFLARGGAGLPSGARGRLAGLQLSHKAEHILRAVVEGLAMELARYLRLLTEGGICVQRVVVTGGAAASRLTPQIISDVTGLALASTTESDMSALGAAMIARGIAEPDVDLTRISEKMVPPVRAFERGPNADFYRQLFDEYVASLPKVS